MKPYLSKNQYQSIQPQSSAQEPNHQTLEALCISMLQEQQRSRRWSNIYKAVMLTLLTVFMMAVYSNQYSMTQTKLTERQICQEGYSVNDRTQTATTL